MLLIDTIILQRSTGINHSLYKNLENFYELGPLKKCLTI